MTTAPPRARGRCLDLPPVRGPWTERLFGALLGDPREGAELDLAAPPPADPLRNDDMQLALYISYELHYSAIAGVDERWEWSPALLALRGRLQRVFDRAIGELVGEERFEGGPDEVPLRLLELAATEDGPSLSRFVETQASEPQMLEHVIHRSAYQLKEADPHSWAIPRLEGGAKAALLEIQFDEYGGGTPERMHSELFAQTMAALGLDPSYGAYLARLPGITLATVNLLSGFGLRRSRRGALAGHLAMFEMTSTLPNRRYGNALRRLGHGSGATAFYDEHVEADAVHENIAAWDLAGGLARQEPETAVEIVHGARALLALEGVWAAHLLDAWRRGESSLLDA